MLRGAGFAGSLLIAAVAAGAACAQPAATGTPEQQAAGRELSFPKTGVGGCVFRAVKPDAQRKILMGFMARRTIPPELPTAVAEVSERCTGRPFSRSDAGLTAATVGAFQRTGVALYFAVELGIGQHRLDDVWRTATAEEKAPFLKSAADLLDPNGPARSPSPADTEPFARKLGVSDPRQVSAVNAYYLATAEAEAGEAKLAAEGVKPRSP